PTAVPGADPAVASRPATTSPARSSPAAIRSTAPAPQCSIKQPATGIPTIAPKAIASRTVPSAPFDRPSDSRRSGTREARVAKQKPLRGNTSATALRAAIAGAGWTGPESVVQEQEPPGRQRCWAPGGAASSQDWKPISDDDPSASSTT